MQTSLKKRRSQDPPTNKQEANDQTVSPIDCALDLLRSNLLPGIQDISSVGYRCVMGGSGFDLVGRASDGSPSWHFSLTPDEDAKLLRGRLLKEHAHRTRAHRSSEPNQLFRQAREMLSGVPEMRLNSWGIRTATWRQEEHPAVVLMIGCLGRDAKPANHRIVLYHEPGLGALALMIQRHRLAQAVSKRWKASGAIGSIEATAASVMNACGIQPKQIMADLEQCHQTAFQCAIHKLRVTFTWKDFNITAMVRHRRWRLSGNLLTVSEMELPLSTIASLVKQPLSRLVEIEALPSDAIMDTLRVSAGDLEVALRPAHVLI